MKLGLAQQLRRSVPPRTFRTFPTLNSLGSKRCFSVQPSTPRLLPFHATSVKWQGDNKPPLDSNDAFVEGADDLHDELRATVDDEDHRDPSGWGGFTTGAGMDATSGAPSGPQRVHLVRLDRPPGRFDLLTNSLAFKWETNAADARKVSGPLREWAAELKYRTGVHMELEPTNPARLSLAASEGGYATADEVEVTVYLFGSERGVFNCSQLMESIVQQEPSYVRLAVFRRVPSEQSSSNGNVEWLTLRRINRELRPPDIPPISLKTPGKHTLLFETYKEAAVRTLWEETGITVDPSKVYPTARLSMNDPRFYWRVPVHYFIAEVPFDVEVKGPQADPTMYLRDWEKNLLKQSPDPIDRVWASTADPLTGCAWLRAPIIDELQRPLKGDEYMQVRYTPPPYSELSAVVGLSAGGE